MILNNIKFLYVHFTNLDLKSLDVFSSKLETLLQKFKKVCHEALEDLLTFLFRTVSSSSLLVSRIRDSIESPFDPWLLYWFFLLLSE